MFGRTLWKLATPLTLLLFVLAALLLAGCGDDSTPPVKPPDNLISRADGGTASLNGQVTVFVPPEAISEDAEMQFEIIDTPPALPDGYGFASPVYDIGLSTGQVVDTVFITVTYLNGLLPEGLLEASLLIGYVDGQNWVFDYPTIQPVDNHSRIASLNLGQWAVIWREQDQKGTVAGLLDGLIEDVGNHHRADFELVLGAAEVSEVVNSLNEYAGKLDAASVDDPAVSQAVLKFLEANQDIENDGNEINDQTAIELTRSFVELGYVIGQYTTLSGTGLPEVKLGSWRFLPGAFSGLFKHYPGYESAWAPDRVGQVNNTAAFQHDFFVQLNYTPTFGGLTYLDPPAGVNRLTRVLSHGATGTYRVNLVEGITSGTKTVYYDYIRSRGIALYWPVESEVVLFNMLGVDNSVDAVGYTLAFDDLLVEYQVLRENPFSPEVQTDSTGSWVYFGFPQSLLNEPRKQDLLMNFITGTGGVTTETELAFPVNVRPWIYYGDWSAPSTITDLSVDEYRGSSVRLSWTAPGNDADSGTASWYDLRMANFAIDESNWEQAIPVEGEPLPDVSGTEQTLFLLPFDLSETVYMIIKTYDQDRNNSELSNLLQLKNLGELEINFTDIRLEQAIRSHIAKPADPITGADVAGITSFAARSQNIRYLNGMEFLTQMSDLDLTGNLFIRDLSPLIYFYDLRVLRLNLNRVTSLSPLAELTQLQTLELNSNRITDISVLAAFGQLDTLDLSWNSIADLEPLAGLTGLSYLDLMETHISDVTTLATMTGLKSLFLARNQITDLTGLLENPGLGAGDTVDVNGNPLSWQAENVQIPALEERGVVVLYEEP